MLTGENGIFTQAQRAKEETENAQSEEKNTLANYESVLNSYSGENTEFTDSLGNKVKVPAGFRVVNPGDNVEDGIIIEDVTIELGRYTFDSSTGKPSTYVGDYAKETVEEHTYKNIPAKNIEKFKTTATSNGGYYIGRYEARTEIIRKSLTEDNELTQITTKPNDYVYNWVTETYSRLSAYPCAARGGVYASNDKCTDFRTSGASITYSNDYDSFRPILYL